MIDARIASWAVLVRAFLNDDDLAMGMWLAMISATHLGD
jgi:hypothetical protein